MPEVDNDSEKTTRNVSRNLKRKYGITENGIFPEENAISEPSGKHVRTGEKP
jgi:hypothetical protein